MLVLTRKVNQSVIINDDIVVKVAQIYSGKVRLAISAPRNVSVVREELLGKDNKKEKGDDQKKS